MRISLGVLLLCFSTIIGYFLAGKYVDRKKFYKDFLSFNQKVKREILFNKNTLLQIITKENDSGEFYFALNDSFINKNLNINYNYLDKEDKEFFINYVKNLGTSDIDTQIEFINKTNELLVGKFNQVLEQENKYKMLYIKMGFLIGLTLMVIVL